MGKRKKRSGGKGKKRRVGRVGSMGNPVVMTLIGAKVGDLVNGLVTTQINKMEKPPSPYIVAGGQAVIGYLAMTRSRNPLIQGAGVAFLAAGGVNILNAAGVLKGIGRTYRLPISNGNGTKELPTLNGQKVGQQPHWRNVLAGAGVV